MAVLRGGHGGLVKSRDAELVEIKDWYREALKRAPARAWSEFPPVRVGRTWEYGPDGWVLPEFSAGWDTLAWCGYWLRNDKGKPWQFSLEQARFILWSDEIDSHGEFVYTSAVLQRLKGHGKDPLGAAVSSCKAFGPSVPDGFGADGQPVLVHNPAAWVQIYAVSQEQTKNTMKLFPQMITPEARDFYGIQIGRLNVWGLGDSVQIEAPTSSDLSSEGNRPSYVIRNETQNWNSSNRGHDLAGVIDGNASKSNEERPARILDICNAYREGEDSVAQRTREGWEETQATFEDGEWVGPKRESFGLYYDSLEAPPKAPLNAETAAKVIADIRGDSTWVPIKGAVKSILNPNNSASESRRKWYNQIQAEEDSWTTAQIVDALADTETVVESGEEIGLFFDASKSDDSTGLMGVRVLDGHVFTIGLWQKPAGKRGEGWLVPREDVDAVVTRAHEKWNVRGFFGDPSHVIEDESMNSYWDGLFDEWHRRWGKQYVVWASRGKEPHSVMFDMSKIGEQKQFVAQVALTEQEMIDQAFTHDGDARLRRHLLNAKRQPTKAGMSIGKDHRESRRKIDLAVCMIGARLVRRLILNSRKSRKKGAGRTW